MARNNLREYQEALAGRMAEAAAGATASSHLGIRCGDGRWLVDLQDVNEVIAPGAVMPVELTRPWFKGLTNVRGNLIAVIDFSLFLGGGPVTGGDTRIVVLAEKFAVRAALLVTQVEGLYYIEQFERRAAPDGAAPWRGAAWRDADGCTWNELAVRELVRHPQFLQAGEQAGRADSVPA
jgi:twitching motility protein PilI